MQVYPTIVLNKETLKLQLFAFWLNKVLKQKYFVAFNSCRMIKADIITGTRES